MEDLDTFAVQIHVLARVVEGLRRPRSFAEWCHLTRRGAHPIEHCGGRKNRRAGWREVPRWVGAREQRLACSRNCLVPPDVIRICARIDHVSDGPCPELLDGGEHRASARCGTRVHDDHAVNAHLHGDVAARADEHVEIGPAAGAPRDRSLRRSPVRSAGRRTQREPGLDRRRPRRSDRSLPSGNGSSESLLHNYATALRNSAEV